LSCYWRRGAPAYASATFQRSVPALPSGRRVGGRRLPAGFLSSLAACSLRMHAGRWSLTLPVGYTSAVGRMDGLVSAVTLGAAVRWTLPFWRPRFVSHAHAGCTTLPLITMRFHPLHYLYRACKQCLFPSGTPERRPLLFSNGYVPHRCWPRDGERRVAFRGMPAYPPAIAAFISFLHPFSAGTVRCHTRIFIGSFIYVQALLPPQARYGAGETYGATAWTWFSTWRNYGAGFVSA